MEHNDFFTYRTKKKSLHIFFRTVNASVDALLEEFHLSLKLKKENSSRNLVEFCCSKTVGNLCCNLEEKIIDGSFARFTFDMMLAWESPHSIAEQCHSVYVLTNTFS